MFIYFLAKTIQSANSILNQNKNNCVIKFNNNVCLKHKNIEMFHILDTSSLIEI